MCFSNLLWFLSVYIKLHKFALAFMSDPPLKYQYQKCLFWLYSILLLPLLKNLHYSGTSISSESLIHISYQFIIINQASLTLILSCLAYNSNDQFFFEKPTTFLLFHMTVLTWRYSRDLNTTIHLFYPDLYYSKTAQLT